MPYGARVAVGGSGALAATGFALGGWVIGAITLIFLGIAIAQMMRPRYGMRP